MKKLIALLDNQQRDADNADLIAFSTFEKLYDTLLEKVQSKFKVVGARWIYDENFDDVSPLSTFPKIIYIVLKGGNEEYIHQQDEETMAEVHLDQVYLNIVIGGEDAKLNQDVADYINKLLGAANE